MSEHYDYAIIGAGVIGLTIAMELRKTQPDAKICFLEKECKPAMHSSGRNSGVLHAGFYYAADSLKARFTRDGNKLMKAYCRSKGIAMNECGKLVVARNAEQLTGLRELKNRGDKNGVEVEWITESEAHKLEPNARTYASALFSPTTASVNPGEVCAAMAKDLEADGVRFFFETAFVDYKHPRIVTNRDDVEADYIINCAGLYADEVAQRFEIGKDYVLMPFKGVYLKWSGDKSPVNMNVYPVPNLKHPFLGVHFTITADGHAKIGPTAMPAFWRENYSKLSHFSFTEAMQVMGYESMLMLKNSFGFRALAFEEMKKFNKNYLIKSAAHLVQNLDPSGFKHWGVPGIRAQLMHRKTLKLEQDFIVERGERSLHVLNAVSPGFTCSFPIAEHVVKMIGES